jgi:pyruvate kinase
VSRRTRIVATLGPATDTPTILAALIHAGIDAARINYSHGSASDAAERIAQCRRLSRAASRTVAILGDLPGPKLRVRLPRPLSLAQGQVVNVARAAEVDADLHVTEPEVISELRAGERILLDDGRLQLRTVRAEPQYVVLRVEVGGTLMPNKGLNLPDTHLSLPALTPRDHEALAAAAVAGVDWLALSFVRSPQAADELKNAALSHGFSVPVMAKIERPEAVAHADEIIEAFDGIMVARGDLGVEIPLEHVPHIQKHLIARARAAGKPVVTATDMLDSMRNNTRPTRAEANDVANAVYDGTDALMLSGETAVGHYPVEAVAWMDRIAQEAEAHFLEEPHDVEVLSGAARDHISRLTCRLARDVEADAIVAPTTSGRAARLVARHRPSIPIVAPATAESVRRQLAMVWGVRTVPIDPVSHSGEDRLEQVVRAAFSHGAVRSGNRVVVMAEHARETGERFPTVRVVRVGESGQSHEP